MRYHDRAGSSVAEPAWRSCGLSRAHDLAAFDCGVDGLNAWLRDHAIRAQEADTARTYVWTDDGPVVAYFSIAPTEVVREEVTRGQSGGYSVIPGYLLARLALDRSLRGQGLGTELLLDAVGRIMGAAEAGGGRLIVVDALDDAAAKFYRYHDFHPVKQNPLRLVLKIATARQVLGTR